MSNDRRGHNAAKRPGEVGFQPVSRPESSKSLTDAAGPDMFVEFPMTVRVSGERLGPRGGRGNWAREEFDSTLRVRSVHADEAPVAFTVEYSEYRHFDGKFYKRNIRHDGEPVTLENYKVPTRSIQLDHSVAHDADLSAYVADSEDADSLLFVDSEQWVATEEPVYYVQTFGFGGNHGGTSLSVGSPTRTNDNRYRLDEFEAAREHAIEVAAGRGDTESVARFEKMEPKAEVLDPSLLTYAPPRRETEEHKHLRWDYRREVTRYIEAVVDPDAPLDEDEAWERLVALRKKLKERGGVEAPR